MNNPMSKTKFIRKQRKNKIIILKRKKIVKNRSVFNQIFESEKNIKKGRIKEFKY